MIEGPKYYPNEKDLQVRVQNLERLKGQLESDAQNLGSDLGPAKLNFRSSNALPSDPLERALEASNRAIEVVEFRRFFTDQTSKMDEQIAADNLEIQKTSISIQLKINLDKLREAGNLTPEEIADLEKNMIEANPNINLVRQPDAPKTPAEPQAPITPTPPAETTPASKEDEWKKKEDERKRIEALVEDIKLNMGNLDNFIIPPAEEGEEQNPLGPDIEELGIDVRIYNTLIRHARNELNQATFRVGEILSLSPEEFMDIDRIGESSFWETLYAFVKFGVTIKPETPPTPPLETPPAEGAKPEGEEILPEIFFDEKEMTLRMNNGTPVKLGKLESVLVKTLYENPDREFTELVSKKLNSTRWVDVVGDRQKFIDAMIKEGAVLIDYEIIEVLPTDFRLTAEEFKNTFVGGDVKLRPIAKAAREELEKDYPELFLKRKSANNIIQVCANRALFIQQMLSLGVKLQNHTIQKIQPGDFPITENSLGSKFRGRMDKVRPLAVGVVKDITADNPNLIKKRKSGKGHIVNVSTNEELFVDKMIHRGAQLKRR